MAPQNIAKLNAMKRAAQKAKLAEGSPQEEAMETPAQEAAEQA